MADELSPPLPPSALSTSCLNADPCVGQERVVGLETRLRPSSHLSVAHKTAAAASLSDTRFLGRPEAPAESRLLTASD